MNSLMNKSVLHERQFIAEVLMMRNKHNTISLHPNDIVDERIREVWEYCQTVDEISVVEIEHRFDRDGYIGDIISGGSIGTSAAKEAKAIKAIAHQCRVAKALSDAQNMVVGGKELSDVAGYVLNAFDDTDDGKEAQHIQVYMREAYKDIMSASEGKSVNFVKTGIQEFDDKIGGLQKDGLVIVAGRPSMGKTSFAISIAKNIGMEKPVLFISMEMSGRQMGMRFMAAQECVDLQEIMQGNINTEISRKLSGASEKLVKSNIYVNEKTSRTVSDVAAEARRFKRKHGELGLVIIDYLTLLKMPASANQVLAVAELSRAFKVLAGELKSPIMLLSQLNRSLESRVDKKPMMSDLRDSGAIEQDADQIIFPYREEVYQEQKANEGVAEIYVAKNRNGRTGSIIMSWIAKAATFSGIDEERKFSYINRVITEKKKKNQTGR